MELLCLANHLSLPRFDLDVSPVAISRATDAALTAPRSARHAHEPSAALARKGRKPEREGREYSSASFRVALRTRNCSPQCARIGSRTIVFTPPCTRRAARGRLFDLSAQPAARRSLEKYQRQIRDRPDGQKCHDNQRISFPTVRMQNAIGERIEQHHRDQRMQHIARVSKLPTGGQSTHQATRPFLLISGHPARDGRVQREQQCKLRDADCASADKRKHAQPKPPVRKRQLRQRAPRAEKPRTQSKRGYCSEESAEI